MVNDILVRFPNETEEECLFRIGSAKRDGLLDATWPEVADFMNKTFRNDETEYYSESAYRKKYKNYIDAKEMFSKQRAASDGSADELNAKLREISKERVKLQTEKLEYNKWLREEARDELIAEKIVNAIKENNSLMAPAPLAVNKSSRSAILAFGDEHYATEFTIYGLHGEIINSYSPEIFELRMWSLFYKVIDIIEKEENVNGNKAEEAKSGDTVSNHK